MVEGLSDAAVQIAGEVTLSDAPGQRMREARTRYGFTQTWLAPHLDVRRESLSRIESGHSKPTLQVVERFAKIMALARHVRAQAARLENTPNDPDPRSFRTAGREVGLDPETTDDVARQAIDAYTEKRRDLLEGLETSGGSR